MVSRDDGAMQPVGIALNEDRWDATLSDATLT